MTAPNMRPLSFGEILDGAFTLYRRHFLRFVGTSALMMAGFIAAILFLGVAGVFAASVMPLPLQLLVGLVIVLALAAVATMMWSTLAWQAARSYEGRPAPLGESVDVAWERSGALMGAAVIAGPVVAAALYGTAIAAGLLQAAVDALGSPELSLAAGLAGGLGLAVAAMLVLALFFGVLPAVMVEDLGPWKAVVRSVRLARGALGRIAGTLLLAYVIVTLPTLAVMAVTGGFALASAAGAADPAALGVTAVVALVAQQLLTLVVGVVTLPYQVAVMVLLYYDRRVRAEALDVEIAASRLSLAGA